MVTIDTASETEMATSTIPRAGSFPLGPASSKWFTHGFDSDPCSSVDTALR